ncbi:MAG: hypothetical protein DLM72_17450 [Candidatus Nitrosopolaris wilkensis]|nr:MAG: hypothetical protein DLM72_17450 [Candidatus Nitrosopolaris wilkensis]
MKIELKPEEKHRNITLTDQEKEELRYLFADHFKHRGLPGIELNEIRLLLYGKLHYGPRHRECSTGHNAPKKVQYRWLLPLIIGVVLGGGMVLIIKSQSQ